MAYEGTVLTRRLVSIWFMRLAMSLSLSMGMGSVRSSTVSILSPAVTHTHTYSMLHHTFHSTLFSTPIRLFDSGHITYLHFSREDNLS